MFGYDLEGKSGKLFFQYAFACTSSTIVSGSLAERAKIENYLFFSMFMTGFIYPVIVSWTWGKGWLFNLGYQDFAGSSIVHLCGGISGLAGSYISGPRLGRFNAPYTYSRRKEYANLEE